MRIAVGWNSFKLRSFSFQDLGIAQREEFGMSIEVRQKYFHFCFIPFFSLGKIWTIRRGNQLYEVPADLQTQINASATAAAIKTPFYTYTGPLLFALIVILIVMNSNHPKYPSKEEAVKLFNAEMAVLDSKRQHLTTKDFITVQRLGNGLSDTTIYLKIEDINGDQITVTPVEMTPPVTDAKAFEVDDEYTRHASTLPSVKISNKQLQAAFVKDYLTSGNRQAIKKQGINLLNDGKSYIATDVVRHFGPVITRRGLGSYGGPELTIGLSNTGWPATISDIKELTGNGDWSDNLNQKVGGRDPGLFGATFRLNGYHIKDGQPYKIVMTLKDTTGQLHQYEIAGVNLDHTVKEL
ncbi:hypothetical protein A4H97_19860 [Niastella yeongjuensis]|uniref:Uncharacterized protein n=1 Tax=Niastella yeongjuensis TaxID=354355 RepID=A0A1V9FBW6_9BACT|nr:hypothetical protein [Niastella yeongjuensis]OQP55854.1 hypothetical protein A4H97_19860 [Niastella yeongjuensis]SEP47305.1 hypothetical protein SAMN05660816_06574 [Niastella yeongjuensis]